MEVRVRTNIYGSFKVLVKEHNHKSTVNIIAVKFGILDIKYLQYRCPMFIIVEWDYVEK